MSGPGNPISSRNDQVAVSRRERAFNEEQTTMATNYKIRGFIADAKRIMANDDALELKKRAIAERLELLSQRDDLLRCITHGPKEAPALRSGRETRLANMVQVEQPGWR